MGRRAVFTAVVLTAMLAAAPAVSAADCWLLNESALTQAQAQGRCHDVFARGAAEAKMESTPKPDPKPAAKPIPTRKAPTPRRSTPKPAQQPDLLARLMRSIKPSTGSPGHTPRGIDHLNYGRTSPAVDR